MDFRFRSLKHGYPLAGIAPRPSRRANDKITPPPARKDRIDLAAPVIFLPPVHPGVAARRKRPVAEVKLGLETFSGRALLTARCILKSPAEVLEEVRALSGTVSEEEMNRLFQNLDVERLILRALNHRDPHNRMDAMDRRLLFVAETAGRGRYWLEHQLDWRDFADESRPERLALLYKVIARLRDEHRTYTHALHAVDQHAALLGLGRRESLLALAAAADQGRALLEPNGHSIDQAQGVAFFLASVHREKGVVGLVTDEYLDSILRYAEHEASAAADASGDIVSRVEENTLDLPGSGHRPPQRWWRSKSKEPKQPPLLLPVDRTWFYLRIVGMLILLSIAVVLWRNVSKDGAGAGGAGTGGQADWFDLLPKDVGK